MIALSSQHRNCRYRVGLIVAVIRQSGHFWVRAGRNFMWQESGAVWIHVTRLAVRWRKNKRAIPAIDPADIYCTLRACAVQP